MITRFITEVTASFNPFSARAKICRIFISQFGPSTFRNIKFSTKLLPQASKEPSSLKIKFRTCLDSLRHAPCFAVCNGNSEGQHSDLLQRMARKWICTQKSWA